MSLITHLLACNIHTAVSHSPYTLHCAVRSPQKQNLTPLIGIPISPEKNDPLTHLTYHPKWHNSHTYTKLLLILSMNDKLAELTVIINGCTTHKQQHTKFSGRLAQISPTEQLNHATGNNVSTYNLAAKLQ